MTLKILKKTTVACYCLDQYAEAHLHSIANILSINRSYAIFLYKKIHLWYWILLSVEYLQLLLCLEMELIHFVCTDCMRFSDGLWSMVLFSRVYLLMLSVLFLAWAGMFKAWSKWWGSCYRSRQVSGITEQASPVHIQLGESLFQVQQLLPGFFFFFFFLLSPLHMSSHFKHTKWFAMGYRIWCNTTLVNICKWQNTK